VGSSDNKEEALVDRSRSSSPSLREGVGGCEALE
jgi:hypothetical protein